MMKSQPTPDEADGLHTNQISSQHKHKYNTELGNEFSLDEKKIMMRGKGTKGKQIGKMQTHYSLPLDKRLTM
jgi:hypothetical protein